ncbi:MAG: hypothetical protein ABWX70_10580 [Hyphomicrobium sp.]
MTHMNSNSEKFKSEDPWEPEPSSRPHALLRATREAAGFASARAAAEHHGWPVRYYRSREDGSRSFKAGELENYLRAFSAADTLHSPDEAIGRLVAEREQRKLSGRERREAKATRLKIARLSRGHRSMQAAAAAIGLNAPTYESHERGINAMADPVVSLYAAAFGIRPEWLTDGTLPSGLGSDTDARMERLMFAPQEASGTIDLFDFDPVEIARLKAQTLKSGQPVYVNVAEVLLSTLIADIRPAKDISPPCWTVPSAVFAGISGRAYKLVRVDMPVRGLHEGEKLFVVIDAADHQDHRQLVLLRDGTVEMAGPSAGRVGGEIKKIIGIVVGRFQTDF